MKELSFLFANYAYFLVLFLLCLADAVIGILKAVENKTFEFRLLPAFLIKMLRYTVILIVANVMEYYGTLTGWDVAEHSIQAVSGILILAEFGDLNKKFKEFKKTKLH